MASEGTHDRHTHRMGSLAMTGSAKRIREPEITIVVARDFSRYPGGRYKVDGEFSGEAFREEKLVPALREANDTRGRVVVDIDGAAGYPSSFLEEAFGGLVREGHFTAAELSSLLVIRAGALFDSYRLLAEKYLREAKPLT